MWLPSSVARAARNTPVSAGLLLFMCLILLLSTSNDATCIDIAPYDFYPWRFMTYPFAMTTEQPWRIALGIAVIFTGTSAEAATSSSEYATFIIVTTIATGLIVLLIDLLMHTLLGLVGLDDGSNSNLRGYTGVWPVAEAIAFSLCRARGVSAFIGPRLRGGQLTLQQLPLAIVWLALSWDVASLVIGHSLEDYNEHTEGCRVMVASIALLVSWLYERGLAGAANNAHSLEIFMYPSAVKSGLRWVSGRLQRRLQASPLRFLLASEGGASSAAAGMPMPLFSRTVASTALPSSSATTSVSKTTALLPGTTAEDAERYRLIAREALAHRLGQQATLPATAAAEAGESDAKTA
ncbi:hypothetical protein JKF63_06376 [Porcisia hertigi]|uniref:Uncharacterized protein n=1 Tax=Porcisia hertigi TaxID=2761500 RepID=A0A836LJU0_9TRYP|nr:hypothetical protein JKF63_06376 [Porcisia hertigi]